MKLEKSLPCTHETATVPSDQPAEFGKFTTCSTLIFSSYEHWTNTVHLSHRHSNLHSSLCTGLQNVTIQKTTFCIEFVPGDRPSWISWWHFPDSQGKRWISTLKEASITVPKSSFTIIITFDL